MALINGSNVAENLTGSPADDTILGLGGDDTLIGNGGRDLLNGDEGFDVADFTGTTGDLDVDLAAGVERAVTASVLVSVEAVNGAGGDDAIAGSDNANRLDGSAGDDILFGAGGDDTLIGYLGSNVLNGGAGTDTADYEWARADDRVLVNLADGLAEVTGAASPTPVEVDALSSIENAVGGEGDDTLVGSNRANVLSGGGGNDGVSGGEGDDTLSAGQGRDTLRGGDGFDTVDFDGTIGDLDVNLAAGTELAITNSVLSEVEAVVGGSGDDAIAGDDGANRLDGGAGDDMLSGAGGDDTLVGGRGGNVLDGGSGRDTADYGSAAGAALINLADGNAEVDDPLGTAPAAVDALLNIENATGGEGSDTIIGDSGGNVLTGGAGNDTLSGGGGNDTLDGGAGIDRMAGGAGDDTYAVDSAGDVVDEAAAGSAGTDSVRSSLSSYTLGANLEDLALTGAAAANGTGNALNNRLTGNAAANALSGGEGADTLSGGGGGDTLEGGAGADTAAFSGRRADYVLDAAMPFFMGGSVVLTDTRGSTGDGTDTVTGVEFFAFSDGTVPFSDLVVQQPRNPGANPGGRPPATAFGTAGDDRLALGVEAGTIDGLSGRDWLDLTAEGSRSSTVTVLPDGTVQVAHGARIDALYNVEEIRFLDGRVVFDPVDDAARVARLYEAALDRLPDQGGFNFWIDALREGYSLSAIADGFLGSPEFQARFGGAATADGAFVDRLYLNILDRAGEAEGRAFWIDSLARGVSRAEVLAGFSESPENKAGTAALIQTGLWDRSETAADVARLYDTVFGRKPDASGLAYWKELLEAGTIDLAQASDQFTGSAEFQATYGNLDNRSFASALYVNTLDRPAEAEGLDFWTGRLDAGVARSAVVLAFSESQEHVELTALNIQSDRPGEFGIIFA